MSHQLKGSTIPFGYEEIAPRRVQEVPLQIAALKIAFRLLNSEGITQREAAEWLKEKTGRHISHRGLAVRATKGAYLYGEDDD